MPKTREYKVGALCAGYGGLELGIREVLKTKLEWFSEIDPSATKVMKAQFPEAKPYGDLELLTKDIPPKVDIVTAGFPCQPVSVAAEISKDREGNNSYRKGIEDKRWLINNVCLIARKCEANFLILENVPGLLSWKQQAAWEKVYQALYRNNFRRLEWGMYRASDVAAPHQRRRWFCIATNTPREKLDLRKTYPIPPDFHLKGKYPYFGYRSYIGPKRREDILIPSPPKGPKTLPTPTAREHKDSGPNVRFKRISDKSGLTGVIMHRLCKPEKGEKFKGWESWRKHNKKKEGGDYRECIEKWEDVMNREAPNPLRDGKYGLLSPEFVEWMMGLPEEHVTGKDIGLPPGTALRILGNGVVPQQAAYAVASLANRMNGRVCTADESSHHIDQIKEMKSPK